MRGRLETGSCFRLCATAVLLTTLSGLRADSGPAESGKPDRWFSYTNVINEEIPLSIHVVRIERAHHDFEFCTTLGKGSTLGMAVVSEQVKAMPPECGQALAAINGDFYEKSESTLAALVTFRCNWNKSSAVRPGTPVSGWNRTGLHT